MVRVRLLRRLWRRATAAWRRLTSLLGLLDAEPELHTTVTVRAVVDAVLPETPALADELGPEHVPGGLAIDLDDFLVTYANDLFQFGLPGLGSRGNLPLADPVAQVLDVAADALLDRGGNESPPDGDRVVALLGPDDPPPGTARAAAGPFAKLSRRDRLRAISVLDEFEVEVSPLPDELFELDGGLVGQLVIGFAEMIYYGEWEGYDEFTRPPGERVHPNDPSAVQSWRQTGFPGFANGYAALRGYVGADDGPLGEGEPWATIDGEAGVRIVRGSGSFRDNDYDTVGYEEPHPE